MRISYAMYGRHYRLIIVGSGSGGLGASHKFARYLPQQSIAIIDAQQTHYYQPGFTLVGGGLMSLESNRRPQSELIHPKTTWIQSNVATFIPKQNTVVLEDGEKISYDYMIVATGTRLRFDLIKGLPEALDTPGVCSNYSPRHVEKTYQELNKFQEGNCIFTLPNSTLKCPGAPQKAVYISDEILRKLGKRDKANFYFCTALGQLFGIDAYRIQLEKVANEKKVEIKTRRNLIEVDSKTNIARFEILDGNGKGTGEIKEMNYSLLHITPACLPISALIECNDLTDINGWVDVNPFTLQSTRYSNVFGVGDCINTPNSKTAAAISSQLKSLEKNVLSAMEGKELISKYDHYASCPLVVSTSKVILAEFTPKGRLETTPIDQSIPSYSSYWMKRYLMPFLYWNGLIKGYWNGPATLRRILHLGLKK